MPAVSSSDCRVGINRRRGQVGLQTCPLLCFFLGTLLSFFSFPAFAELQNGMDADIVIGQPDFVTNSAGTTQSKISATATVTTDGRRLIVSDGGNHRVLIFNTIPTKTFQPADVVVGQGDFSSLGTGLSADRFNAPRIPHSDGKRLFVPDLNNNRVLIWNNIPTSNGAPADVVVGQTNFTSQDFGTGLNQLFGPLGVFSDGKRLFVADSLNNRVLIWNSIPTTNGVSADIVLGSQGGTAGTSSTLMTTPAHSYFDGKKFFVSDLNNHRILIWNSLPTQSGTPADLVLGQPNFDSNTAGVSPRNLNAPTGIFSDGRSLYVADGGNGRVLIWKQIPEANFAPADIVLGQSNFDTVSTGTSRNRMTDPVAVATDGERLIVGEDTNRRVLIFNLNPAGEFKLGPHFEQGKSVLGKVFEDKDSDGWQDKGEKGIEGVKVASDTGIYAITDEDGKYHFPFIETGQRVLKIDPTTLPDGAAFTTESPRKVVVTKGMLTKVSFGVRLPATEPSAGKPEESETDAFVGARRAVPLLKVSISQDPSALKPRLSVSAVQKVDATKPAEERNRILFTIDCNYFLFIHRAELKFYDQNQRLTKVIELPSPLPLKYEIPSPFRPSSNSSWRDKERPENILYYQLFVFDSSGREDRTGIGRLSV